MSQNEFDAIYCISGINSKRRPIAEKRLHDAGINFEFFDAIMIPENGNKGCYKSHQTVWKNAYNKGYKKILVFEDDLFFLEKPNFSEINRILNNLKDWEIFYLGHSPLWFTKIDEIQDYYNNQMKMRQIIKTVSFALHGYILNINAVPKLLDTYVKSWGLIGSIDTLTATRLTGYAIYPQICIQDFNFKSEIHNKYYKSNPLIVAEFIAEDPIYKLLMSFIYILNKLHFYNPIFPKIAIIIGFFLHLIFFINYPIVFMLLHLSIFSYVTYISKNAEKNACLKICDQLNNATQRD
jgi:GR25 family glycosyltransferase involved in LPS biosynthesis